MNGGRLDGSPLGTLWEGRGGGLLDLGADGGRRRGFQDCLRRELCLRWCPEARLLRRETPVQTIPQLGSDLWSDLGSRLGVAQVVRSGKMLFQRGRRNGSTRGIESALNSGHRSLTTPAPSDPLLGISLELKPKSLGECLNRITGIDDGHQKQDRQ